MIAKDIYLYLAADTALQVLLEATEADSKLYPNIAKMTAKPPFIVYRSTNPGGTTEEVISEESLNIIITAADFEGVLAAAARVTELLDGVEDVPAEDYYIYYAKKTGGNDYVDDLNRSVRVLTFSFKFRSK
ncbi:hypothetical protein AAIR98_001608 [Elusimicrobium simillimum]|uniref:hypothetical protein n=1 Tax=Elusimicrobium simillimum TaxID=3143438 RepID=UPI003C6F6F6B